MKYLSIDIETTGLNPKQHQILEIAVVAADTEKLTPVDGLPTFHCYLNHKTLVWDVEALKMNAGILAEIQEMPSFLTPPQTWFIFPKMFKSVKLKPEQVMTYLRGWLVGLGYTPYTPLIVAGKNFDKFDLHFLNQLQDYDKLKWDYRSALDPAILYLKPEDTKPPSLQTCLKRAFIDMEVKHRAIDDAQAVVRLIRHALF